MSGMAVAKRACHPLVALPRGLYCISRCLYCRYFAPIQIHTYMYCVSLFQIPCSTKGPNSEDNMWCLEWRWQSGRVIRWWLYPGAIAPGRVMMQGIWKSDTQYIYVCIWMGAKYLPPTDDTPALPPPFQTSHIILGIRTLCTIQLVP
jgi:hypothetical protein